jgi:transposase-like protein
LRDAAAAKRLFRKALSDPSHPQPRVINTDQARLYGSAIAAVKEEGTLRRRCRHRGQCVELTADAMYSLRQLSKCRKFVSR